MTVVQIFCWFAARQDFLDNIPAVIISVFIGVKSFLFLGLVLRGKDIAQLSKDIVYKVSVIVPITPFEDFASFKVREHLQSVSVSICCFYR